MNEMDMHRGLPLVRPRCPPVLHGKFRPAVLANRAFRQTTRQNGAEIGIALERADGSVSRFDTRILSPDHPRAEGNFLYVERLLKFLLWSRGGCKIYFAGPPELGQQLQRHYRESSTGKFDACVMGERMYDRPFEVVVVAAVRDGRTAFSDETAWDPRSHSDPLWHFEQIMDSLRRAAAHLPRVDAIGGSSAGVYVRNRVKVASLFRGVPEELFEKRVKNLFLDIQKAWGGVPLEVVNDGEVTALAGAMAINDQPVLGMALGSSLAVGYVNREGNITAWLNELAFAPVDYNPAAPVDEWSGDYGCGVQYFSQQAVGRLIGPAGIEIDAKLPLSEKLVEVQKRMAAGDERAAKIYETI